MKYEIVFNPKLYPREWEVWAAEVVVTRKWFGFGKPVSSVCCNLSARFMDETTAKEYLTYLKSVGEFKENSKLLISENSGVH